MLEGFNLIALDKNFEIVSLLRFSNLQWNRKYFEMGTFSIEIPLEQYNANYKYLYTATRPELGEITQINYISQSGYKSVNLSGYFLENQLNRRVVYELGTTNITNSPAWALVSNKAENVAYSYFEAFKNLNFSYNNQQYQSILDIEAGQSLGRGLDTEHERDASLLGDKIHAILQPSEMSYRIKYDFENSKKIFEVWKGIDRTEENTQGNNPIIFSTKYGNIKNPNILIDSTEYKNCYIVKNSFAENGVDNVVIEANCLRSTEETALDDRYISFNSSARRQDYATYSEWLAITHDTAKQEMNNHIKTINVEFDALEGSYEYMVDFDLGDKCSVEIPEMALSVDTILVGCYEVVKNGVNTLTMEFGTPLIK